MQPLIGKASARKQNIRSILITQHNRLYYKVTKDTIYLLGSAFKYVIHIGGGFVEK